jgi:hypothetical protein
MEIMRKRSASWNESVRITSKCCIQIGKQHLLKVSYSPLLCITTTDEVKLKALRIILIAGLVRKAVNAHNAPTMGTRQYRRGKHKLAAMVTAPCLA